MRVRPQCKEQPASVNGEQDDAGRQRNRVLADVLLIASLIGEMKNRRKEHRPDRHHKHARIGLGAGAAEDLLFALPPADQHRDAGNQQQIPQDRSGERSNDQRIETLDQRDNPDDKLGRVSKRRVQ